MKYESNIKKLLINYMNNEISKIDLINTVRDSFNKNMLDKRYDLNFIREYYFMSEILDLSDCNEQECKKYISEYIDIYNGKSLFESTIAIKLTERELPKETLTILDIVNKIKIGTQLTSQECDSLKCFIYKPEHICETIYDLVIDQLKNIILWGFDCSNEVQYIPKSILYVSNDEDIRTSCYEKMDYIVKVLLGENMLWVVCSYKNGECNLKVV